jgi:histidinol-phosphate/aromatic aminotransferase/cobyric acid decarboxylase-like protein
MTTQPDPHYSALTQAGFSKTVYALVMPETEAMLDRILDGGERRAAIEAVLKKEFAASAVSLDVLARKIAAALAQGREPFHDMYREAWTRKQDAAHEEFFAAWKKWSAPVLDLDPAQFPHMYPTGGASEGLREAIETYATHRKNPVIHVFEGEYEGFSAYAQAAGVPVKTHKRADWKNAVREIGAGEQFYISQPSAIDGNVWPEFEDFARALHREQPDAELMLDLTYVGCVGRDYKISANHPNISTVFFSLSKPFGGYYHRIGGCLSRHTYDGLFGNKWFKNLLSLRLGTEMMKRYAVQELPRKYAPLQAEAAAQAGRKLGVAFKTSDVFLLASAPQDGGGMTGYLNRGGRARLCLTPTVARLIKPEARP